MVALRKERYQNSRRDPIGCSHSGRASSHSQRGCSFLLVLCARVGSDFVELFESGFEVGDDFLGEDVEISNITPAHPDLLARRSSEK